MVHNMQQVRSVNGDMNQNGRVAALVAALRQTVRRWLPALTAKREFNAALANAYEQFATGNQQWTASLFDWHFLSGRAHKVLAAYARGQLVRPSETLATVYLTEIQFSLPGRHSADEVRLVAAHFLSLFDRALLDQEQAALARSIFSLI